MHLKVKHPLECNELRPMPAPAPAPTDFLSNLCRFHIPQSAVREFSHNFISQLLLPELLKCTNTKLPVQKSKRTSKGTIERPKSFAANKVEKKQLNQKGVPGYRVSQCIDVTSRLSGNSRESRISPKSQQVANAGAALNKKNPVRNCIKSKAPTLPMEMIAANEKMKLTKQKNDETLDEISGSNTEPTLVRAIDARQGDLMISEIIIKFCRKS